MPDKKNDPSNTPLCSPENGRLFIISAPSGAGKTTLCNALLKRFTDLRYSVSHTTRPPRDGEQNGVDYYFVSIEEFKKNIERNLWAEWAEVHGHFYGTSAKFIESTLCKENDILLDIDVQGAKQILKRYPDAITIFIMPPSIPELEKRLKNRGNDSRHTIAKRLTAAEAEIAQKKFYTHEIINDSLPEAVEQLTNIINHYHQNR